MPRAPKPLSIFRKPRHPRHNWDSLNQRDHEAAVARALDHERERKTKPIGLAALRAVKRPKVRFGRLPKRLRPAAEAELARLMHAYIQRTGHAPSQQKHASLIANATFIISYVRSGKLRTQNTRFHKRRRLLDSLDRDTARVGTPAAPTPPRPRSSYRGLQGI